MGNESKHNSAEITESAFMGWTPEEELMYRLSAYVRSAQSIRDFIGPLCIEAQARIDGKLGDINPDDPACMTLREVLGSARQVFGIPID